MLVLYEVSFLAAQESAHADHVSDRFGSWERDLRQSFLRWERSSSGREPDQGDPKTKEGRPQAAFKEKL
jgi:hypothetical protein